MVLFGMDVPFAPTVIKIDPARPVERPDLWDICDEQFDILIQLHHALTCNCHECLRRDRLIALLMEPMR